MSSRFSKTYALIALLLFSLSAFSIAKSYAASSIAVIVNNDVITDEDIKQRIALILFSSGNGATETPEMRKQVEEALIQECLQKQIAKRLGINISDNELNQALTNIAKENKMSLDDMKKLFAEKGVRISTLADRIKANLLWIQSIRAAFASQIRISDSEIEKEKQRLLANEKEKQAQLYEIVLLIDDPKQKNHVQSQIKSIHNSLKTGTPFEVAARNFSQSPSSAQGGLIGWVNETQQLKLINKTLKVGEYGEPIAQGNRFIIYYCKDLKNPGEAPLSEAQMTYMTAAFKIPEEAGDTVPENIVAFKDDAKNINNCATFKESAKDHGGVVEEIKDAPAIALHPEVKNLLTSMPKGAMSAPVRVSQTDVIFFILCSQKAPGKKTLPTEDEIRMMLMERAVQDKAIMHFNQIKATSTIENRTAR